MHEHNRFALLGHHENGEENLPVPNGLLMKPESVGAGSAVRA